MKQSIKENNILIARFMTDEPDVLERDLNKAGTVESMLYHCDWNWLMPILKRIGNIMFVYEYGTDEFERFEDIFPDTITLQEIFDGDIQSVWERVIEFINWYNNDK